MIANIAFHLHLHLDFNFDFFPLLSDGDLSPLPSSLSPSLKHISRIA